MTVAPEVTDALAALADMLAADGYALSLAGDGGNALIARIDPGPDACADCLVPKSMLRLYFQEALKSLGDGAPRNVRLVYPGEG
jgi:hypothetical protein